MLSGELRLSMQEVELAPVVRDAIETVRPAASANGIVFEVVLDERAGQVRADPGRIQQVVWNLVDNAVKFTGQGGRVSVLLLRLPDGVRIEVADTGKGIDPQLLPHVFERFRTGDASSTRAHRGLGLGLAIARQLVELHGGTVHAASAGEGKGATFTVELPLPDVRLVRPMAAGTGPAGERPFVPSPILKDARVLLVEDDPLTRAAVQWLLEQCEAQVTAVESAAEAIAALRAVAGGRRFDALVSDIGMAGQNGYQLMRTVRSLERDAGEAPIPAVALTAYAAGEDRDEALSAGFQMHVAKPVEAAALVRAVAKSMGRAA
jgi:CheY-like chemotaxis protein